MTDVNEVFELLSDHGCDIGEEEKRHERAGRLVNEGIAIEDLQILIDWAHVKKKKPHTVGGWLNWVTATRERWTKYSADIRRVRAVAERRREEEKQAEPNQMRQRAMSEAEKLERLQGLAYCCVVADEKAPERVADELGITVEQVLEYVEIEKKRRPLGRKRKPDPEVW